MIFLANSASFHLKTWRSIYGAIGHSTEQLLTVHPTKQDFSLERRINFGVKFFSYAALGLFLRLSSQSTPLHAHGASGYGLSALLSGRKYIVTIYGSEIFGIHSWPYQRMVKQILASADVITVTSTLARARVLEIVPTATNYVNTFHTGIDIDQIEKYARDNLHSNMAANGRINILSIRNSAPVYDTREILKAVDHLRGRFPQLHLTVPLGNGDLSYFLELQSEFPVDWITFLPRQLPHEELLALMLSADICVNFPVTDQVSTTLLEAVYLNKKIVTCNLPTYAELFDKTDDFEGWYIAKNRRALIDNISDACLDCQVKGKKMMSGGASLIKTHFNIKTAEQSLRKILEIIYG